MSCHQPQGTPQPPKGGFKSLVINVYLLDMTNLQFSRSKYFKNKPIYELNKSSISVMANRKWRELVAFFVAPLRPV
jgi:hypothetical protein